MSKTSPFDPNEFFITARALASEDHSEACLRSAVGRAYYAAFLVARERVQALRPGALRRSTKRGWHQAVIAELKSIDRTAGDQLDSVRKLRVSADYYIESKDSGTALWQTQWHKTETIVTQLMRSIPLMRGK